MMTPSIISKTSEREASPAWLGLVRERVGTLKFGVVQLGRRLVCGAGAFTAAAVLATLACGCVSSDVRPPDEAVGYRAGASDSAAASADLAVAAHDPRESMVLAMPLADADRAIGHRAAAGVRASASDGPSTEKVYPTIASKPALEDPSDDEELTLPLAKVR
jgi:hypothetical protein